MARVAFLVNGPGRGAAQLVAERFEAEGLELDEFWAYHGEFPEALEPYDGVFLSGSPHGAYEALAFIEREHAFVEQVAASGMPMLGVCFGSQILASALCGRDQVFRRDDCEVGYEWLDPTPETTTDPIATDLGGRFRMFVWHNDEARAAHPDMRILASTPRCPNQVWRYRDAPIWGIQGHPEVTLAAAPGWFEARRTRLEADGVDVDNLIANAEPALEAKTLLANFAQACRHP